VKCPRDVHPLHWEEVLAGVPKGWKLREVKRSGMWRDLVFDVTTPIPGWRVGDRFITSVATKISVR
jgi:hypothetical protein